MPRATISRGPSSASGSTSSRKRRPAAVDDDRAFAAQRLGRERRGILADVNGGRVELHEFGVGDQRSGFGRHRHAFAAALRRIGRDAIEPPDPARREHQRRGGEERGFAFRVARHDADRASALGDDAPRDLSFDDADRGRARRDRGESVHDRASGAVAFDAHDAPMRMRGLARRREQSRFAAIEGNAESEQVLDARARFLRHAERHRRIDEPRARADRILGVHFGRVRFFHGRGDAALRPKGGGGRTDAMRREHSDRRRREL